jgi:hypothetical protein
MRLIECKQSPMSDRWELKQITDRLLVYSNRQGKLYAQDKSTKKWYKIER